MYKICCYFGLFLFAGVHFGQATVPTVLSITNLSTQSITLTGTLTDKKKVEGENRVVVRLSDENQNIKIDEDVNIEVKKDERTNMLLPVVNSMEKKSEKAWELTTNGMGRFLFVIADKHADVSAFYRKKNKRTWRSGMPSMPDSIMQSSRDCKQLVAAE